MSEKATRVRAERAARAQKREQFAGEAPRRLMGSLWLLVLAVGVSLVAVGLFMLLGVGRSSPGAPAVAAGPTGGDGARRAAANFTTVVPVDGAIRLKTADFDDAKAHFYTLRDGGKEIDFFVVKSSDGVLRAAIDSCDVCYPARKGYRQEGNEMVCNNCGQRFASTKINVVSGGCNPVPLTRTTVGDELIIQQTDVVGSGGGYF